MPGTILIVIGTIVLAIVFAIGIGSIAAYLYCEHWRKIEKTWLGRHWNVVFSAMWMIGVPGFMVSIVPDVRVFPPFITTAFGVMAVLGAIGMWVRGNVECY